MAAEGGTKIIGILVSASVCARVLRDVNGRSLVAVHAEMAHARPRQLQGQQDDEEEHSPAWHGHQSMRPATP